ncbi:hypothetical protein NDU88_006494 [Pleurodeles waltl]|uniref:Uncharacterized protein n=1 Tax=Pleurodeles waltl TaxID=8319 RepID=A0AAV7VR50_PLEWA|nr:hypothetical protein NDU88_006494 [Pleurodeles waltl]
MAPTFSVRAEHRYRAVRQGEVGGDSVHRSQSRPPLDDPRSAGHRQAAAFSAPRLLQPQGKSGGAGEAGGRVRPAGASPRRCSRVQAGVRNSRPPALQADQSAAAAFGAAPGPRSMLQVPQPRRRQRLATAQCADPPRAVRCSRCALVGPGVALQDEFGEPWTERTLQASVLAAILAPPGESGP